MEEGAKALSDIPAINRFLSYCRIRTVPSKTVIIHAGDLPDILYYIISGSVEVMIEDEDGNEMVLAYLNKGQFFGEMGLFYEQPTRSAWVRTRQQSELAEMTYPRFRQIAAESPGLIFELATQLATRLDRTNRKLGDLAFVDVTGRVAHAIMDLCGEPDAMTHPEGMQIKVSRQELSRLVGCSREMAGRVLKVLEEQGLLRATGKTIVVFNARPKVKTRPLIVPVKAGSDTRRLRRPRKSSRAVHTTRTRMTTTRSRRRRGSPTVAAARSAHAARRTDRLVGFLDALGLFLGDLRHGFRQPVGDQLVGMVPAHLPAIGLGDLLIAGGGRDLELRIAFGERLLRGRPAAGLAALPPRAWCRARARTPCGRTRAGTCRAARPPASEWRAPAATSRCPRARRAAAAR